MWQLHRPWGPTHACVPSTYGVHLLFVNLTFNPRSLVLPCAFALGRRHVLTVTLPYVLNRISLVFVNRQRRYGEYSCTGRIKW